MLLSEDLPWDKEKKYIMNNLIVYYEVTLYDPTIKLEKNYYYPLRNEDQVSKILRNKKIYLNGVPVLVIVSRFTKFYSHFLKNKQIVKR